jgi:hypothetical protein
MSRKHREKNPNTLYEVTVDYSTDSITEGQYIVARGKLKKFKVLLEASGYSFDPGEEDVHINKLGEIAEVRPRIRIEVDGHNL